MDNRYASAAAHRRPFLPPIPTSQTGPGSSAFMNVATVPCPLAPRGATPGTQAVAPSGSAAKRARKERQPNWLPQEVLILIRLKKDLHLMEIDHADVRDLMMTESTKWAFVSQELMGAGFSRCLRDPVACKTKWNQLIPDYKKISDYCSRTGRNIPEYWQLSSGEKKSEGLPRQFPIEYFNAIHEWFNDRAQMQPPHVRDLLSPTDGNYEPLPHDEENYIDEDVVEPQAEQVPLQSMSTTYETTDGSSASMSPTQSTPTPSRTTPSPSPVAGSPFAGLPPGVIPYVISSSDNTAATCKKRLGSTAMKRKNMSGHTIVAEATKEAGAALASQMQVIANASLQVERSKMEAHQRYFTDQMTFLREKDRRLYEASLIVHENARLSITKQGDMVMVLSQLTDVLGKGFAGASSSGMHNVGPFTPDFFTTESPAEDEVVMEGIGGSSAGPEIISCLPLN